ATGQRLRPGRVLTDSGVPCRARFHSRRGQRLRSLHRNAQRHRCGHQVL
ncbi:MAG: hypothetical protein AVDCRST_MAG14-1880, partial [uncultured Rubrobacteraceae bacterium]